VDGLHRPSGRTASPDRITPSPIMSPARSPSRPRTKIRLGVHARATRTTNQPHAPPIAHGRSATTTSGLTLRAGTDKELQLLEVGGRVARGDPTRLPWGLDARRPVSVAARADRRRVVEHRVPAVRPPAGKMVASQPAPAPLRVLPPQPANDPPPRVVGQVLEGPRRLPGAEVGAPTAQHRVEPVQELVERLMGAAAGDLLDLRLDGRERRLGREQEDARAAST
jgi:hypothetical protein